METQLVEIGPRMVLLPIRIFSGSFGGTTLYNNGEYISPNEMRAMVRSKAKNETFLKRAVAKEDYKKKVSNLDLPASALDDVFKEDSK